MDNQFAASSALDDNERHYIGDLLSDDDAFSCAFKPAQSTVKPLHNTGTSTNLTGSFSSIGPSPNGNFWPEPPPPYSAAVGVNSFSQLPQQQPKNNKNSFQSSYNGIARNNNLFYTEKTFSNAWADQDDSMLSDYFSSTIFEGFGLKALDQNYDPFNFKETLSVNVDANVESPVWSLSKESSSLEHSPKTSNGDEEDHSAQNISPVSRFEDELPKPPENSKLAEIEKQFTNPSARDSIVFCPPVVNLETPKQSYSDVVTNRSGELSKFNAALQPSQPKLWNKKQDRRVKAGSVDRAVGSHRYGNNANPNLNNIINADFRKIIRKKGVRSQQTPSTPTGNSTASSNNQSPAKKHSECVVSCEPLYADKRDISAGVIVHTPSIKVDSSSRFEVLQSLPSSPTKKANGVVKDEEKVVAKEKASNEPTPVKNNERSKRRGLHHKLFGSVSQSRSASKKPIPVTAVGTINTSVTTITTSTKKGHQHHRDGGTLRFVFNVLLALLGAAVEFLFHQLTSLFFAVFFALQQGTFFVSQQLCNGYRMFGQFLSVLSCAIQYVLRRLLVSREQRLALFLSKEPSPSLQDLDDHFFLDVTDAIYSSNIQIPRDVEPLLERLYKCFYADPYVVLGLRRNCTDEEITSYYNAQSSLVDPEKVSMHACAQAYDLLSYAYAAIGTPEERESYDRWAYPSDDHSESTESSGFDKYSLWRTWCVFRNAMDQILRTLHCDCGINHICVLVSNKNPCEARFCRKCDCPHPARQNDIWAESSWGGLYKCYYACLEGNVYDVSQWAACACTRLKNLKANSHSIHYRLQGTSGYTGFYMKGPKGKSKGGSKNAVSLFEPDIFDEFVYDQLSGDTVSVFPDRSMNERPRRAGRRRKFR